MSCSDEALVIEAAEKYGFNLEFKTRDIFRKHGYSTEINKMYSYKDGFIQIDVEAKLQDRLFLVECKGTASDSLLILIQDSKDSEDSETIYTRRVIHGSDFRIMGFGGLGRFCTSSGDFFTKDQKKLKKTSKNDTENNFFKAQTQITDALCAVHSTIKCKPNWEVNPINVMPVIVTNAKIWAIDYEETPKKATQHKWVKHKVISNTELPILLNDDKVPTYLAHVVNVDYLGEFLDKCKNMNRSYETVDTLNNTKIA